MHARIKELHDEILKLNSQNPSDINVLKHLRNIGATATEAMITLHLGFNFSDADAENIVFASKVFSDETLDDIGWQTAIYLMGYSEVEGKPGTVRKKLY